MPGNALLISPPAQDLRPAAAGGEVERLAAAAAAYADASMSASTRRAYQSSWRAFCAWCDAHGAIALPASPDVVCVFLAERAPTSAVASLGRHLAAIRWGHREFGWPPPESARLTKTWSGIRRTHGAPQLQKRALVTADLAKVVKRLPPTIASSRDAALLLIGYAGALRRSELVALELDDGAGIFALNRCTFVAGGLRIALGRSKTDQERRGQVVAIPRGKTRLCPVAALERWLEVAGIRTGPIFREVDRHGRIGARSISDRAAADIVKRSVARAGFDPRIFSGHSLRAGFVTAAAGADVPLDLIMQQTRHTRAETVLGYIRESKLFARNAAGRVGL